MNSNLGLVLSLFWAGAATTIAGPAALEAQSSPGQKDENSRDLFYYETTYTFDSDSLYDDFSYDHRFLLSGKWYLRLGVEYERYDFGDTDNGLPDHLQAAYGHLALEYVVKDFPGAGIELDPGVYFQDKITGDAFDIPGKIFFTLPLKKEKIFGVVALGNLPGPASRSRRRHHLARERQAAPAGCLSQAVSNLPAKRRLGISGHRRDELYQRPHRRRSDPGAETATARRNTAI